MTPRKRSKNAGDGGTGVYKREGTTSRVMAADRPYGVFYNLYSDSPEYFGYYLANTPIRRGNEKCKEIQDRKTEQTKKIKGRKRE
jgi:hypothetical protein